MKKQISVKRIVACLCMLIVLSAVLSACGEGGTYATQKNFITIGCVCPLTGELAGFGEGSLETEEESVRQINEDGGVYIDTLERKLKVRFVVADSMSTEDGARQAAKRLIDEEHVDMLVCSAGAKTALPAAAVCETEKVPFFSVGCENEAWIAAGTHTYAFNCAFDNAARIAAFGDILQEQEISSVGLLAPATEEGERFALDLAAYCEENDLELVDPGRIKISAKGFRYGAVSLQKAGVEAAICYLSPAEFSAMYTEGSFKNLDLSLCMLVSDDFLSGETKNIQPAAEIKEFYTATCWDKTYPFRSSLTEEEGTELAHFWEGHFLSQSSELTAFKHAASELAVDAVKLAMALDAEAIRSAADSLNADTILGTVDFDSSTNSSVLPCSVLHWTYDAPTVSWKSELVSHTQLTDVEFEEE